MFQIDNGNVNLFNNKPIKDWYCSNCDMFHNMTSRRKLQPFAKKHGFKFQKIEDDGDCFFSSIVRCFPEQTIYQLRKIVSDAINEEQFEFYKVLSAIETDEYSWVQELYQSGILDSIDTLKDFICICGNENNGDCFWADEFAIHTIGKSLDVNILFIDFESEKNNPYRILFETENDLFIVLLRKNNHFEPLCFNENEYIWNNHSLPPVVKSLWNI